MQNTPLKIGVIGGSGLGETFGDEAVKTVHTRGDMENIFGKPSSDITVVDWSGTEVCLLKRHGDGHLFNPSSVPYRANLFALKELGVTHILASGATGSLRENIHPGELVIADQIIDRTNKRVNTFYPMAAVHVEFSQPFCPVMRKWLLDAATRLEGSVTIHNGGTYVCMEGPAFSTLAESEMHRQWGGDLIGMTAMPEARLAREAEMAYALIAMPTDYDCWKPHEHGGMELLQEIIGNLKKATASNLKLMKEALSDLAILKAQPSPAHSALALGIWSDKSMIEPSEVEKLDVLWGKYFEG